MTRLNRTPLRCSDLSRAIAMAQESIDAFSASDCADSSGSLGPSSPGAEQLTAALDLIGQIGSQRFDETDDPTTGAIQLGRFHILNERGRGGFGIVLRAFDPHLKRIIALKIPRPERLLAGQSMESLAWEGQLAAKLEHPGIVRVYESGRLGPVWYIASAYCDGPTLGDWLSRQRLPISSRLVAEIVRDVANAVHYAHTRGVLHLDLKPGNILLDDTGNVENRLHPLVTDFGLASPIHSADRTRAPVAGTPAYMAPEQWIGDSMGLGIATDVFGLGAILYDLLSPSAESAAAVRSESSHSIRSNSLPERLPLRNVSKDLDAICQKCLQTKAENRYSSVSALALDLQRYLNGDAVSVRSPSLPEQAWRLATKYPVYAASLASFLFLATVTIVSILRLWRAAESNLVALRSEQQLHASTAEQMRSSLLSLTWLVQERQIDPRIRTSETDTVFALLQDFYTNVKSWGNQPSQALTQRALLAASHSLAMVGGITPLEPKALEEEFIAGVHAWQDVIETAPDEPAWKRALALHVLSFSLQTAKGTSIWWRTKVDSGPTLDPRVAAMMEIPYARLLLALAQREKSLRHYDNAFAKLDSAIYLLQSHANVDQQDEDMCLLLTAYNELAIVARHLGRSTEVEKAFAASDCILAAAPEAAVCSSAWRQAISDAYIQRAAESSRQEEYPAALGSWEHAIRYCEQNHAVAPSDISAAAELAHAYQHYGQVFVKAGDNQNAVVALSNAIRLLSAVHAEHPNHRSVLIDLANSSFALSNSLIELGDKSRAMESLEACEAELHEACLGRQDSRTEWMVAIRATQTLAKLYQESGRLQDSAAAHRRALVILSHCAPRFSNHPQFKAYVARSRNALVSSEPANINISAN